MTVEKLTALERSRLSVGDWVANNSDAAKALRIIDQLTEALAAEQSRRVEHRQMNQSLNEVNQSLEKRVAQLTEALAAAERVARHAVEGLVQAETVADEYERERDAANALLRRSIPVMSDELLREVGRHLSGQPATPTRTEAEQAVLEATARLPERWLRMVGCRSLCPDTEIPRLCRAELARRGAKP